MKLKVLGNIPFVAHEGDAGLDLAYSGESSAVVQAGETRILPTGTRIELPEGWCALVLPRSGLAFNSDITIVNAPGLIDSGYRGEIKVALHKLYSRNSSRPTLIKPGDRIAQLLIVKTEEVELEEVQELSESVRGDNGFGSSGTAAPPLAASGPGGFINPDHLRNPPQFRSRAEQVENGTP